jgi:hypothetical protein
VTLAARLLPLATPDRRRAALVEPGELLDVVGERVEVRGLRDGARRGDGALEPGAVHEGLRVGRPG